MWGLYFLVELCYRVREPILLVGETGGGKTTICHLRRPNCKAITAVEGQYQIRIYNVLQIQYGEEITFDYNSVTESKKEYEESVCLCGSQVCRMSYLNLTGEGAFQKVLKGCRGILDQYQLMSEACELNIVSEEVYIDLGRTGRERIKY